MGREALPCIDKLRQAFVRLGPHLEELCVLFLRLRLAFHLLIDRAELVVRERVAGV